MINSDSYTLFTTQYSISTRSTKPSMAKSSSKTPKANSGTWYTTTTQHTDSVKPSSRVYRTKQFSHQKVEYVRKQDQNTVSNI